LAQQPWRSISARLGTHMYLLAASPAAILPLLQLRILVLLQPTAYGVSPYLCLCGAVTIIINNEFSFDLNFFENKIFTV
jgi:hypothetical protein